MSDRRLLLESLHPQGPGHPVMVIAAGSGARPVRIAAGAVVLLPSGRLRAEVVAPELRLLQRLVHVPSFADARVVIPLRPRALKLARSRLLQLSPLKAAALGALRWRAVSRFTPTSQLLGPATMSPPFQWLANLPPRVPQCTAVVLTSGRPGAAVVLLRISGNELDMVVKVGGRAEREAENLGRLGPAARAAGVGVPEVLWCGRRDGVPLLAQTPLPGEAADRRVNRDASRAVELMQRLADWLRRWNAATAQPRPLEAEDIESRVLAPARRLSGELGVDGYVQRLEALGARCQGRMLPFVAAHNDLTMANVQLGPGGLVGVLDWEAGEPGALPLGDLAYGIADAAAAVGGYADRAGAYPGCFDSGGRFWRLTQALIEAVAHEHGLDDDQRQLCLQACWLHHAANERERDMADPRRPFLAILRRAAAVL